MDNNNRLWILGTLASLALSGAYIFWGPVPKLRRRSKDFIPGLQNLGNSCFLNAVLQALASWSSLVIWLEVIARKKKYSARHSLANALHNSLEDLNTWSKSEFINPSEVIQALRAKRWVISNEEQDAHELFHVLTTTLEEESLPHPCVLSLLEPSKLKINDNSMGDIKCKIINRYGHFQPRLSKYECPTRGLLASQLKCKTCGYRYPIVYDTFDSISLVIPNPHWGQLRIQDCLQKYISSELVHGVNCDGCRFKKQSTTDEIDWTLSCKSTFFKQVSIGKLPACLCFHVQRTVWLNNGIPVKCSDHVSFPEFLSMDDYVYHGNRNKGVDNAIYPSNRLIGGTHIDDNRSKNTGDAMRIKQNVMYAFRQHSISNSQSSQEISTVFGNRSQLYILKAVIVHLGNAFSGHFIAYRRSPINQCRWFYMSDTTVKEVKFSEVLQSSAYMLFYERILPRNINDR